MFTKRFHGTWAAIIFFARAREADIRIHTQRDTAMYIEIRSPRLITNPSGNDQETHPDTSIPPVRRARFSDASAKTLYVMAVVL